MAAPEAIAVAIHADRQRLLTLCRSLAPSQADAEDLFQDTVIKALTKPPPDLDRPLWPWLKRVAKNLAVDRWRVTHALPAAEEVVNEAPSGLDADAARDLVAGLGALSPAQRSVVLLRDVMDLSAADTATATGHSEANVRVLHHRARKVLAETLARPRSAAATIEALRELEIWSLPDLIAAGAADPDAARRRLDDDPWLGRRGGRHAWLAITDALVRLSLEGSPASVAVALHRRAAALAWDQRFEEGLLDLRAAARVSHGESTRDAELLHAELAMLVGRYDEARAAMRVDTPQTTKEARMLASTMWRQGDHTGARQLLEQTLGHETNARERLALTHALGLIQAFRGETDAEKRCREAWEQVRESANRERSGWVANALGCALQNAGKHDEAERWFRTSIALAREFDQPATEAYAWNNLGLTLHETGRFDEAEELFLRTIRFRASEKNWRSWAVALGNLGVLLHARGHPRRALRCFDEALHFEGGTPERAHQGFLWAHVAAARANVGAVDAVQALARAASCLAGLEQPRLDEILDACTGVVDVASGHPDRALARLRRLTEGDPPPAATFLPLRLALALLHRAVDDTAT